MKHGIKFHVVGVVVSLLAFTTLLNVLLAWTFTNRQHEEAAFESLRHGLLEWQSELTATADRVRHLALATAGDVVVLQQIDDVMTLERTLEDTREAAERADLSRTLGYRRTVAISRLQLALQAGGFSSIEVWTLGHASHRVTRSGAGLRMVRSDGSPRWLAASADAAGALPLRRWPAWTEGTVPEPVADQPTAPGASILVNGDTHFTLRVQVPIQAIPIQVPTENPGRPVRHFYTRHAVAGANEPPSDPDARPVVVALIVFDLAIDAAMLRNVPHGSQQQPMLMALDGSRHLVRPGEPGPTPALRVASVAGATGAFSRQLVDLGDGSRYLSMTTWSLDGRPALRLGMSVSRAGTVANVRQTVLAVLLAAGATMTVAVLLGLAWVRRYLDPLVALTKAVRGIAQRRSGELHTPPGRLQPVSLVAPAEVGQLAAAFNEMLQALQQSLETLEQRVQERTAELRQQTRYKRTLIDMLPMQAWFKDTDGRYLAVNQAAADRARCHPAQMIGRRDPEIWPAPEAEARRQDDLAVMRARQARVAEESHQGPEGVHWVESFNAPVLDDDGTVLGTVGIERDITDRKAADAAREVALNEAQRLARLRSEFLAGMSHELRTPLNGILGFAQLLQHDAGLDERQKRSLRVIEESGQHLLSLINDILDLARIDAEKLEMNVADVPLAPFIASVCDIVRVRAEQKGLAFSYRPAGRLPEVVRVDDKRLRQVLLNLLSNAVKFTDHGGVTLRVEAGDVEHGAPGGADRVRLRFAVEDSGCGLSAAQLARLFQPFEQFGSAEQRDGGTGLGLAISRQLVRRMGGDIEVTSWQGAGSCFAFSIDVATAGAREAREPTRSAIVGYDGPRRRVVVIDDVAANRSLLSSALSAVGLEVLEAPDGASGIELAAHSRPDLVVVDIRMPGLDGFEVTRALRAMPALADLPIIALSASVTDDVQARFLAAGGQHFLRKPVDIQALLDVVGRLLRLRWTMAAMPGP